MEKIKNIRSRSKRTALISLVSFTFVASAIGIAVFGLHSLQSKVELREAILQKKTIEITEKDSLIAKRERNIESKGKILNSLMQEINEMGDSTITIECKFERNEMPDSEGRSTYDWSIWLKSSVHRLNQIEKVYYQANVPGIGHRNKASVERTNGFLIRFKYYDCLESVRVTIQYHGGNLQIIYMNACDRFGGFNFEHYQVRKENSVQFDQQTISHPKVPEVLK